MKKLGIKVFDILALPAYCYFIYWLSDFPTLPMPMLFSFQDKIHHSGAYFFMAMFAWRCFRHFITGSQRLLLVSALFCSLYGLTDEWHQSFVEGRNSDVMDWVADTLGAVFAMFVLSRMLSMQNWQLKKSG